MYCKVDKKVMIRNCLVFLCRRVSIFHDDYQHFNGVLVIVDHFFRCQVSIILNLLSALNISKTMYITSVFSIFIRQHYALIYNFDASFVEICLVFLNFPKTGWENLK